MDNLFKSFADPTRVRILHLLANRGPEICVCDLVSVLKLPQGSVSRHLMQLRLLGLVDDRRQGTWIYYSLANPEGALHKGLVKCLKTSCHEEPVLAEDLQLFDRQKQKGSLACCSAPTVKSQKKVTA